MRHKLQGAQRVCYALEVVALTVRKVVHRVYLPLIASAVMWVIYNTIDDRIAEVHIRACHINLGTQHHTALLNLAICHLHKEVEILLDGAVAIGAIDTCLCRCALLLGNLLRGLLVDICLALLYEAHGEDGRHRRVRE